MQKDYGSRKKKEERRELLHPPQSAGNELRNELGAKVCGSPFETGHYGLIGNWARSTCIRKRISPGSPRSAGSRTHISGLLDRCTNQCTTNPWLSPTHNRLILNFRLSHPLTALHQPSPPPPRYPPFYTHSILFFPSVPCFTFLYPHINFQSNPQSQFRENP